MHCKACHYSLKDLISRGGDHRCPECGREFDPADPGTFDARVPWARFPAWLIAIVGLAALFWLGYWLKVGFEWLLLLCAVNLAIMVWMILDRLHHPKPRE